ncbi:MAG TPA: GNAT family N-acetyltransferase [Mycobacteriales bacterium]|nr:GNAT family N-acetyltransferase [Mycobacteriales bacterium]
MTAAASDGVIFETERLRAVPWRDDHAEPAFAAYSQPEMVRYLGNGATHPDLDHTRAWIGRIRQRYDAHGADRGFWALERRDTGEVVGGTICSPLPGGDGEHEIGWHVFPLHQRNGYATESGRAAAAYGFDVLGLDEVLATIMPPNAPSIAVARKLGMEHVGRTTKYYDGIEFELYRLRPSIAT